MNTIAHFDTISQLLQSLLTDDIFLVEIKVKPINNYKIYLDADGGLGIEKCIKINRALYKHMEEMALYPEGDFSLEVSSPGIDEPLKMFRQYKKNVGRNVEVVVLDGARIEGLLKEITDVFILVEETKGKNKKKETVDVGTWILVGLYDFDKTNTKCDLLEVYTQKDVMDLQKMDGNWHVLGAEKQVYDEHIMETTTSIELPMDINIDDI